jgi:hypothetical protein
MLKKKLPFTEKDVIAMLNWSAGQSGGMLYTHLRSVPQVIKVTATYLKTNPVSDELSQAIGTLIQSIETERTSAESRRWVLRLKELKGDTEVALPLVAGDIWAETALSDLRACDSRTQTAWAELLRHCLRTTGSAPSTKWLKGIDKYLEAIGNIECFDKLSRWFPLVDKPGAAPAHQYDHVYSLQAVNVDILKGLAWVCCKSHDPEVARSLTALAISAYKKIPGSGPRAGKHARRRGNCSVEYSEDQSQDSYCPEADCECVRNRRQANGNDCRRNRRDVCANLWTRRRGLAS